ncbi:MAG TPA: DUF4279 domain-containing protein [Kineosporiaceae bacterium]
MDADAMRGPAAIQSVVTFVVASDVLSVDQITLAVGCPPDFSLEKGTIRAGSKVPIPARQTTWEIREDASGMVDIGEALARLAGRLRLMLEPLRQLRSCGCTSKLGIVQCITPVASLGFVIELENLQLFAELGAFLDVDQYLEP